MVLYGTVPPFWDPEIPIDIKEIEFATILLILLHMSKIPKRFSRFFRCQEELQEAMDKMPEEVWLAGC